MKKQCIAVDTVPTVGTYSQAVEAGPFVFCSGQIPLDPRTGTFITDDIGAATEQVLRNLQTILAAAGLGLEHVVKTTIFLRQMEDFPVVNDVYGRYFPQNYPARSTVQVAGLPKDVPVEIDAIAVRPDRS